jgi:hypothetical protein
MNLSIRCKPLYFFVRTKSSFSSLIYTFQFPFYCYEAKKGVNVTFKSIRLKIFHLESIWTCPGDDVFHNASIIWGVSSRIKIDVHHRSTCIVPVPVRLLARNYPNHKWIELVNMPLIITGVNVRSINYISWGVVGIFFNFHVYKRFKSWWARHTYILQFPCLKTYLCIIFKKVCTTMSNRIIWLLLPLNIRYFSKK